MPASGENNMIHMKLKNLHSRHVPVYVYAQTYLTVKEQCLRYCMNEMARANNSLRPTFDGFTNANVSWLLKYLMKGTTEGI